ncbi:helix-turn-helix domain-containing protein [Brevibacillus laterosporus]|uniref:helix-turn-helix domain-containing protein n=1 Tax=Brevibacillus laterosporus TaxID=1465 RepID=UPI003D1EB9E1
MNTIGDIIKDFRLQKNISRLDIEQFTKINQSVLWKIENGKTKNPEYKTIKPVATHLNIPYHEILESFKDENRIYVLKDLLKDAIELNDKDAVLTVSQLVLKSGQVSIENRLDFLLGQASEVKTMDIALDLYDLLLKEARVNELNRLVAKIELERYLVERNDFSQLRETYNRGCKILDYITFLDLNEQIIFYYKIGVHAYNLSLFEDCIKHCTESIEKDNTESEMKAKAVFAICNSYIFIGEYDMAEKYLTLYRNFPFYNVTGKTLLTRGTLDAKNGLFVSAIQKFMECLTLKDPDITIHAVNELFRIYLQTGEYKKIAQLINFENEMFNYKLTPRKAMEKANYYRLKAEYQIRIGLFDKGIIDYIDSALLYGKVNAYNFSFESLQKISTLYIEQGKQMEINVLKKLNALYNELYTLSRSSGGEVYLK